MTPPAQPFPEVGAPLNKSVVNAQLGAAAQHFKKGLDALVLLNDWSQAYDASALEQLGFTAEEANLLKSGLGEVPPIDAAVDATSFLSRFWGVGSSAAG